MVFGMKTSSTLAIALVSFTTLSQEALAEFGGCFRPERPRIPEAFPTEAEVQLLASDLEAFIQDSQTYSACLVEFAKANKERLTQAEKQALRAEYDASMKSLKRAASRWNAAYSKYVERLNSRE